jgi:transcriptional regulator with XRE-family HTH domain
VSINSLNTTASPLYNLEPLGIGGAMAESLDSYTHRLASQHRVPRYLLDMVIESEGKSLERPKRSSHPLSLNGPSSVASDYVRQLAITTARPEVLGLGFGALTGAIARIGASRSMRAWCRECLEEQRLTGCPAYVPQLWSIPSYTVCHVHRAPLTTKCQSCGATFSTKTSWKNSWDCCARCGKSLGDEPGTYLTRLATEPSSRSLTSYAELAAEVLVDFVATVPRIAAERLEVGVNFEMLMNHCRKHGLAQTQADLARVTHVPVTFIHELATKKSTPSLTKLVRIAVICEVSLAGLLCPSLWESSAAGTVLDENPIDLPQTKQRKKYDWDSIEKEVVSAISSGDAMTPHAMARKMGICEKQFCLKLGKTVYRLRHAVASQKLMTKDQEYLVFKERVREVLSAAIKNNERTSRKAIARTLGVCINNSSYRKAFDDMKCTFARKMAKARARSF